MRLIAFVYFACLVNSSLGFTYNEATQGDLGDVAVGTVPIFALDLGANVIRGSAYFGTASDALAYDADAFGFTVPAGARLLPNSVRFEYSMSAVYGPLVWLGTGFRLGSGTPFSTNSPVYSTGSRSGPAFSIYSDGTLSPAVPSPTTLSFSEIINAEVNTDSPQPPLDSGLYWISQDQFVKIGDVDQQAGGAWNYALTITLVPIPEPGTVKILCALLLCATLFNKVHAKRHICFRHQSN